MAAGVIDIQLELFPKPVKIIGQEVLTAQLSMERNRQSEKERLFLVYAKQWWKEYLQIRPANQERLVKIFAQVFITCIFRLYSDQKYDFMPGKIKCVVITCITGQICIFAVLINQHNPITA